MKNIDALLTERRWRRIEWYLQETAVVIDWLLWRVDAKLQQSEPPASPLYGMAADERGELTVEGVVTQLEVIARQARGGFVASPDFPIFSWLKEESQC